MNEARRSRCYGQCCLYNAIRNRDVKKALALIKSDNTDVDFVDHDGKSVLWYALSYDFESVVYALIDAGADVNGGRFSVLVEAAKRNRFKLVQTLVDAGAEINAIDDQGKTALIYSLQLHYKDLALFLIKASADANFVFDARAELFHAVSNNSVEAVRELMHFGVDVNRPIHFNGKTALIYAVENRRLNLVSLLLHARADVNVVDKEGKTALIYAVQNNDNNLAKDLIAAGADLNVADIYEDKTALILAVEKESDPTLKALRSEDEKKNSVMVRTLIKAGAKLDICDRKSKTALIYATSNNDETLTCSLINGNADVNITDYEGKSALLYCLENDNEYLVERLIDAGADIDITDHKGNSPLIYAAQNNKEDLAQYLIEAGSDVNHMNIYGQTPLTCAASNGSGDLVLRLIAAGADVNAVDCHGKTALIYVVLRKNLDGKEGCLHNPVHYCDKNTAFNSSVEKIESLCYKLIKANADVNVIDIDGKTALMYAIKNERTSVASALIHAGALVNATDNNGQNALFYAAVTGSEKVIKDLIDSGADINITNNEGRSPLICAVQNNKANISVLIDADSDLDVKDNEGKTALIYSIENDERLPSELINAGADVNITDDEGNTALIYTVQNEYEELAHRLLQAGADVNAIGKEGKTALFYAVQCEDESLVQLLLEAGADTNIKDNKARTVLFYAKNNIMQVLVEQGNAFIEIRDSFGRTPLFYAVVKSMPSATYLFEKGAKLHGKDHCGGTILTLFIEHCINRGHILSSLSTNMSKVLNFLQEGGIKQEAIFISLISSVFCKILCLSSHFYGKDLRSYKVDIKYISEMLFLAKKYTTEEEGRKKEIIQQVIKAMAADKKTINLSAKVPGILDLLFELGASPNYADMDGNTALHYAACLPLAGICQKTVMKICHQLESFQVSIRQSKNHRNETPLLFCLEKAVTGNQQSNVKGELSKLRVLVEVCRFLLLGGSSVDESTVDGKTVFHLVLQLFQRNLHLQDSPSKKSILGETLTLLQMLLSSNVVKGLSVNRRDANLNSTIHLWASLEFAVNIDHRLWGDFRYEKCLLQEIFELLLCYGVKPNDRNASEETPLHLCRTWCAVELLVMVAGANPRDTDASGNTPLLLAAKNKTFLPIRSDQFSTQGHIQDPKVFWKTVLEYNLDPWTVNNEGESVLSVLIESGEFVLAKALLETADKMKCLQSDALALSLLNTICKDRTSGTYWKSLLVDIILKPRKTPICVKHNEESPLYLCCRNIVQAPEDCFNKTTVNWMILKQLLRYGFSCHDPSAPGQSCLDIAKTHPALKHFLSKPVNLDEVPLLIPWTSISKNYQHILAKTARRQECKTADLFWFHQNNIQSGSFGLVFAGINEKDGREVAIKRIEKLRMHRPEDKREITNLTKLAGCEHVVSYLHFFEDEDFSYVVLELMEGNLDDYLDDCLDCNALEKEKSIQLCSNVITGLKYLHELDILHRDLKPSNILFKMHPKLCLKIADFGLSINIGSASTTVYGTIAGTRCWTAPELLKSLQKEHSKASDVFSCGLLLHYILSIKKHPFAPADSANKNLLEVRNQTEANVMRNKMEGWEPSLMTEATELIHRMLESDEKKRPLAAEAVTHPLFWPKKKKMAFLIAVGNQPEFECPRALRSSPLTGVENDVDNAFGSIIKYFTWHDPGYPHMSAIYTEMTSKRKVYHTSSVVELVRFIRNTHAHVSQDKRPIPIRKLVLEDFVFLEYFPDLVLEVFNSVKTHGWDTSREEIKYELTN